jgi:hypothetical protein
MFFVSDVASHCIIIEFIYQGQKSAFDHQRIFVPLEVISHNVNTSNLGKHFAEYVANDYKSRKQNYCSRNEVLREYFGGLSYNVY